MADMTSLYRGVEFRDLSIQACINIIEEASKRFSDHYLKGSFTDFLDIQGGTQPPKSYFIYEPKVGYVRFLQIRDFSSDETETYIPVDKKNKVCESSDVLLGRYGASVGKILTGKAGAYNVACAKVNIDRKDLLNNDYLFYLLHSSTIQNQLRGISRSAQGGFNKNDLSRIPIAIPKKQFQQNLVLILKQIDDYLLNKKSSLEIDYEQNEFFDYLVTGFRKRIAVNKEIIELHALLAQQQSYLQLLRQTILQEAVQGKLTQQDPNDEPASVLLQRIKAEKQKLVKEGKLKKEKELPPINEDEIPFELPKGWVWCRLGEVIDLRSGVTLGKTYKDELLEVPYLRVANVQRGYIDITNVKTIKVPKSEIEKYSLKSGDLCMIEGGDWDKVGRCGIWNNEISPCIYQNHIFRLRFYGSISNRWSEMYLNSPVARRYFESCSKQTTNLASINKTQLTNLLYPIPPLAEQQRIVTKVQQLQQQLNSLEGQVQQSQEHAQQLLQTVLKETFTGKEEQYEMNEVLSLAAEE